MTIKVVEPYVGGVGADHCGPSTEAIIARLGRYGSARNTYSMKWRDWKNSSASTRKGTRNGLPRPPADIRPPV